MLRTLCEYGTRQRGTTMPRHVTCHNSRPSTHPCTMDRSPAQRRVGVLLGHVSGCEAQAPGALAAAVNTLAPACAPDGLAALHLVPTHASVQHPTADASSRPVGSLALKPGDCEALTRLLDHDNHDMRDAMKGFMKADLYKPVRVVWEQRAVPGPGAQAESKALSPSFPLTTTLTRAGRPALRHAPPSGARAGAGAPGCHLRPKVLLGAWPDRPRARVPPPPCFASSAANHRPRAYRPAQPDARDCTATPLTRAVPVAPRSWRTSQTPRP